MTEERDILKKQRRSIHSSQIYNSFWKGGNISVPTETVPMLLNYLNLHAWSCSTSRPITKSITFFSGISQGFNFAPELS